MSQPYIDKSDAFLQEWFYDHPELYLHNPVSSANDDATLWMKTLHEPDDIIEIRFLPAKNLYTKKNRSFS